MVFDFLLLFMVVFTPLSILESLEDCKLRIKTCTRFIVYSNYSIPLGATLVIIDLLA